jgi:hypothetical protein
MNGKTPNVATSPSTPMALLGKAPPEAINTKVITPA